jgi:hypothetical protein
MLNSTPMPQVQDFKWQREDNLSPALFAGYRRIRLFSLSKSENAAGWCLVIPGEHQGKLGCGHRTIAKEEFDNTIWD